MTERDVRYRWEWDLASPPDRLWPLAADTNRFDRDSGVPAVEQRPDLDGDLRNARCRVRLSQYGVTLEYDQEPFEWSYPHHFTVTRVYDRGPLARLRIDADLEETDTGGTHLTYEVAARPRNLLGRMAIPIQIGRIFARRFERTFRRYDDAVREGAPFLDTSGSVRLAPAAEERTERARELLVEDGCPPQLVEKLARLLLTGDPIVVSRLRPYELADHWNHDRDAVLDLFLRATRRGLVSFRWDVLCPLCRVAKGSASELDELPTQVHCETCNIDYSANFASSVELTFRVVEGVRETDPHEYCVGSPMATPHVVSQHLVRAGESSRVTIEGEPGRYRLRAYEGAGSQLLALGAGGPSGAETTYGGEGWDEAEPTLVVGGSLQIRNETVDEQLFLVERMAWSDQAVTAAEVIAKQEFRDLFAGEALRPGEQVSVGSLAIAFTDLRDSTRLYQEIGDAVAFGRVMSHFDVLRTCVIAHDGAIVKTIGDAVMAVFQRPADAVAAMLDAQDVLAGPDDALGSLPLKVGIHFGPCIAVTLNGVLDYFGSTVNLAARLEGRSDGSDIVVSEAVWSDPEVQALRSDPGRALVGEREVSPVKGFADQVASWRLGRG